MLMNKVSWVVSALVYIALAFVLPFLMPDRNSILMAWMFMTIWFVLYLCFKLRVQRKALR